MHLVRIAVALLGLTMAAWFLPATQVAMLAQESADEALPPLPRPRPDRDAPAAAPLDSAASAAIEAAASTPQDVTLTARITTDGAEIPNGLVWRVFDTRPDAAGELALVAKSDQGAAQLELPPGEYVVHVAYGRAQLSENMTVVPGANTKDFVLEAGALRLNAAVSGDIAIPAELSTFDIFTGGSEAGRQPIAEGVTPNEIVTLNAGTYHIVSHFGAINAVVRADLRVEPGQLTDATLYHHAAQVSFRLVSEAGGEAIADVEWTVNTADGETLFTDLNAFPTTVLAEGDYIVLAKQGEQVFNREFQVQAGAQLEIEVLTSVY